MMAGHGCLITVGDGHHFIMDDGIMISITAGSGYLVMNGVQPGSPGEELTVIMAGHHWDQV